jgi:hypothetical protein
MRPSGYRGLLIKHYCISEDINGSVDLLTALWRLIPQESVPWIMYSAWKIATFWSEKQNGKTRVSDLDADETNIKLSEKKF